MNENKNKCQDCGAVTDFFLCDACEDAMWWESDLQDAECDCEVCANWGCEACV